MSAQAAGNLDTRLREGARALLALVRRDPLNFKAAQALVDVLADLARRGEVMFAQPTAPAGINARLVSFVVCSIDAGKLTRFRESLAVAMGAGSFEVIAIGDARSLAEGFNRGLAQAQGDIVVFCHDDIDIVCDGLGARLENALAQVDIVGVAGSSRVGGPAVLWCGHPHLHGALAYPAHGGLRAAVYDFGPPLTHGMQSLDGVFVAARRDAARAVSYDAATFDGFHFYDLDFSWRAHQAGLRLAIARDIVIVHESEGSFGAEWQAYAKRFQAKFPALALPKGEAHWYGAQLPDRAALLRFHAEVAGLSQAVP